MIKHKTLFTKEYFEEYARLVLNSLFSLNLIHRKHRYGEDKPDLISSDGTIGVEVARGITERDGRYTKVFQVADYPEGEERILAMLEYAKQLKINEKDICHINNKFGIWGNPYTGEGLLNTIIGVISKKLSNLNDKGFHIYDSNQLFVFVEEFYIEIDKNKFTMKILEEQEKFRNKFDVIYFSWMDCFIYFKDGKFLKKDIPPAKYKGFKANAKKTIQ